MNHQLDARTGIREALPTVFGYIGIGIAFGIVGQAAGFSPLIVSAMSFSLLTTPFEQLRYILYNTIKNTFVQYIKLLDNKKKQKEQLFWRLIQLSAII